MTVDHLMWGAPDLDAGIAEAEHLFGVTAAPGGSHPGLGTRNALLSLGDSVYLEIIAPDPAQKVTGGLAARLAALDECALVTWAAAAPDLSALAKLAQHAGLSSRGPVLTSRDAPDGTRLEWELLFLGGHPFSGLLPFFIDWKASPHPARHNPVAGRFVDLRLGTAVPEALGRMLSALQLETMSVEESDEPWLRADVKVGTRRVTLHSSALTLGAAFL